MAQVSGPSVLPLEGDTRATRKDSSNISFERTHIDLARTALLRPAGDARGDLHLGSGIMWPLTSVQNVLSSMPVISTGYSVVLVCNASAIRVDEPPHGENQHG
jgi:hypothetical protein